MYNIIYLKKICVGVIYNNMFYIEIINDILWEFIKDEWYNELLLNLKI